MSAERRQWRVAGIVAVGLTALACGYSNSGYSTGPTPPVPQVVTASGDLTAAIAHFRTLLGDSANKAAGEQPGGRREINWDGVPAALVNVDTFPGDFFNRVVPRGEIFSTPGSGFRVSDNALADEDPSDATQFSAFSPTKVFASVGSPIIDVRFAVAGSGTPATVAGFGVVFSDVDVATTTYLEFYGTDGILLKRVAVPIRSDAAGHSFAGAVFESALVDRVRIVAGEGGLGAGRKDLSAGGVQDLVVTDDFLSSEPHRIP